MSDTVEEVLAMMDQMHLMMDSTLTDEEIARMKLLEAKHRAYYWQRSKKKAAPPKPSDAETQEYRKSMPIRLRALKPAQQRVFLAELSSPDDTMDDYFEMFEKAYTDIHTYQYAWFGFIMSDSQHNTESLYALRSMLLYANYLLVKYNGRKALCVLRVCERAVDALTQTMSEETQDDRFDLCIQEYKVGFYTSMALAELKRKEDAVFYFRQAASEEQGYRLQAMMEYRHIELHQDEEDQIWLETLDHNVSVLQVISQTLGVSRLELDESFASSFIDKLKDDDIWQCIESLGFGAEDDKKQVAMDSCSYCWAQSTTEKKKFCTRCRAVFYCNKDCQVNDWKYHREDCCSPNQTNG